MAQIGGQIEQLDALRQRFDAESGTVQELTSSIDGQLDGTWWVGPAADRFRESWSGEFKPALVRLQQALADSAAEVARRRQALIEVGS